MSDTPETDAAASPHIGFYSCATVTANFARRLELERNEARAVADAISITPLEWPEIFKAIDFMVSQCRDVEDQP